MDRPRFSSVTARRISILLRRNSDRLLGTDSAATSLITCQSFAGRFPCPRKYSRTAACQVLEKAWSSQVGRCGHRLTGLESSFRAGGHHVDAGWTKIFIGTTYAPTPVSLSASTGGAVSAPRALEPNSVNCTNLFAAAGLVEQILTLTTGAAIGQALEKPVARS